MADRTYITSFPLTEDPLSESGNWICGATVGEDWYDCVSAGGTAQGQDTTGGYTDPTALITGDWGTDQSIEATVYAQNPTDAVNQEVELRLRSSLSAGVNSGYEAYWLCAQETVGGYCNIARFNGDLGDFDVILSLATATTQYSVTDGDIIKFTAIGDTLRVYKNGVLLGSVVDTNFPSGKPGIGFNYGCNGTYDDFGLKDIIAADSTPADRGSITILGYDALTDTDGTWSAAATVPAETDFVLAVLTGYRGDSIAVSSITLDGKNMEEMIADSNTGYYSTFTHCLLAPTIGVQTFAATIGEAWTGGGIAILIYCKGVHAYIPYLPSGAIHTTTGNQTAEKTLATVVGGLCIVVAGADGDLDVEVNSQTKLFEQLTAFNGEQYGAGYITADDVTELLQGYGDYVAISIVSLIPAAGGTTIVPQVMAYYRRMRN